jgi:type II secretory pathway component PulJ
MNAKYAVRGFSLLEVMIALLVVTFGIIGILKFQGELFQSGAVSKQRTIATALAQERMEELRAYVDGAGYAVAESLDGSPNNALVTGIFGPNDGEQFQRDGTTFTRLTRIRAQTLPTRFLDVEVLVDWTTSANAEERVTLRSAVAWVDPANSLIIMSDPSIVATGSCPATPVQDGLCIGTASAALDGQSVSVAYTEGGSGTGQFRCQGGVWFAPDPSACLASCPQQEVSSGVCRGIVAPTPYGETTTISFTSGGIGQGEYLCDGGNWVAQPGATCDLGCDLPWEGGGVIAEGLSVTAFKSNAPSNVSCSESRTVEDLNIAPNIETRTCNNGILSGSFQFATCSEPCLGGVLGNVAHGSTIEVFEFDEAPTCVLQERTCTNGNLSGVGQYLECTPTADEECRLPNGEIHPPNYTRSFFERHSAPGCSAVSAAFVCDGEDGWFKKDGARYTDTTYRFPDCSEAPCTYNLTISTPTQVLCGTSRGDFPGGSSCALSGNTINCTGTIQIDDDPFIVSPVRPARKSNANSNDNSCSQTPNSFTCTGESLTGNSLTCSTAAVNFAVSCTPP